MTKRSCWKYEMIHLGKRKMYKELDCASNDTKLNYSDLVRKYELKDEKGAHFFLLYKSYFYETFYETYEFSIKIRYIVTRLENSKNFHRIQEYLF